MSNDRREVHVGEYDLGWFVWVEEAGERLPELTTGPFLSFGPARMRALELRREARAGRGRPVVHLERMRPGRAPAEYWRSLGVADGRDG